MGGYVPLIGKAKYTQITQTAQEVTSVSVAVPLADGSFPFA
jgi:hypothetical protein